MVVKIVISFFLTGLLLVACQKNNPKTSKIVTFEPFHEVQINSSFDVILQEDTAFFIELKGYQKTLESVDLIFTDGVLMIENKLSGKFLKPKTNKVTLVIHSLPLSLLQVNETCFITTNNPITSPEFGLIMKSKGNNADLELNGDVFYFWNNYPCGGQLKLRGNTGQLKLWTSAIFSVDAKALTTAYALVENNSKGNCSLTVTDAIEYAIKGEGNIEVFGSPGLVVKKEISGSGKFILK